MNLPNSVMILGHRFRVMEEDPGLWSGDGMGRACLFDSSIRIRVDLPDDVKLSTFFHEIAHVVFDLLDIETDEGGVSAAAIAAFAGYKAMQGDEHV